MIYIYIYIHIYTHTCVYRLYTSSLGFGFKKQGLEGTPFKHGTHFNIELHPKPKTYKESPQAIGPDSLAR